MSSIPPGAIEDLIRCDENNRKRRRAALDEITQIDEKLRL